jgi:BirA family biotin operon repressor/biotin-[acetyl-CoA-carboxylase] ligase
VTARSDDRRTTVLAALREAPGGISGEVLATRLGVSRVAVRKHVGAIRSLGYEVDARPGEGYRLVSSPDAPLPLEVAPLLKTGLCRRIEGGPSTGSTNDDAKLLALGGADEGTCVLAAEQTAGRGRLGRPWHSPRGGVYASIVQRPGVQTPEAIVLPLVVGLGAARGLDRLGVDALVKWPNDLYDRAGRKIAGVLCEGLSEGWLIAWIVAGIGVNVRRAPKGQAATCVDELVGRSVPLPEAAAVVIDGVAEAYAQWRDEGFEPLRNEYERRSWLAGRDVRVSDARGRVLAEGRATGVDSVGRLLVQTADGAVAVVAGDITLRSPD